MTSDPVTSDPVTHQPPEGGRNSQRLQVAWLGCAGAILGAFVVPAVLGSTTVGRLWYLPGVMLLLACGFTPTVADSGARPRLRDDDPP